MARRFRPKLLDELREPPKLSLGELQIFVRDREVSRETANFDVCEPGDLFEKRHCLRLQHPDSAHTGVDDQINRNGGRARLPIKTLRLFKTGNRRDESAF